MIPQQRAPKHSPPTPLYVNFGRHPRRVSCSLKSLIPETLRLLLVSPRLRHGRLLCYFIPPLGSYSLGLSVSNLRHGSYSHSLLSNPGLRPPLSHARVNSRHSTSEDHGVSIRALDRLISRGVIIRSGQSILSSRLRHALV